MSAFLGGLCGSIMGLLILGLIIYLINDKEK